MRREPTKDRLLELFNYDDGKLIGRLNTIGRAFGKQGGHLRPDGYRRIQIDGTHFYEHRIMWIWHNGNIDKGMEIDHINGDRGNNKIENLRMLTRSENMQAARYLKVSKSGVRGVHIATSGRYVANIRVDGILKHLGTFDTIADAAKARANAEIEFNFITVYQ